MLRFSAGAGRQALPAFRGSSCAETRHPAEHRQKWNQRAEPSMPISTHPRPGDAPPRGFGIVENTQCGPGCRSNSGSQPRMRILNCTPGSCQFNNNRLLAAGLVEKYCCFAESAFGRHLNNRLRPTDPLPRLCTQLFDMPGRFRHSAALPAVRMLKGDLK